MSIKKIPGILSRFSWFVYKVARAQGSDLKKYLASYVWLNFTVSQELEYL